MEGALSGGGEARAPSKAAYRDREQDEYSTEYTLLLDSSEESSIIIHQFTSQAVDLSPTLPADNTVDSSHS